VIGNPSVAGFDAAFRDPLDPAAFALPELPGAEAEAEAVAEALSGMNYRVTHAVGSDLTASSVLALLYRQPYSILHVSAHSVFDLRHRDGRRLSGLVLSDGVLITAAEVAAMEVVPELVYLSCCHAGTVGSAALNDCNKLASSVAEELIAIGVCCVVIAGGAVDDEQAQLFGRTFDFAAVLGDCGPLPLVRMVPHKRLFQQRRPHDGTQQGLIDRELPDLFACDIQNRNFNHGITSV